MSSFDKTSISLLARAAASAESESWVQLANVYTPLFRRWLAAYDVQDADVDDLIQEVLTVVADELPRFQHNQRIGAFRSWLRKILVHRLRNYWRGRKQQPLAKGGSSLLDQLNQLEDENSQLSRIWNERHDRDVIGRLLELVRPRYDPKTWEAFRRQMFEGQKAADVAAALGMGIGSVYMARNRVLARLRQEADGIVSSFS